MDAGLCGRAVHRAPRNVDTQLVCLMHSKDPSKHAGALYSMFLLEFKTNLATAGHGSLSGGAGTGGKIWRLNLSAKVNVDVFSLDIQDFRFLISLKERPGRLNPVLGAPSRAHIAVVGLPARRAPRYPQSG